MMGLADDPKVKLLGGGFLLTLFALVGIVGFGLVAAFSALVAPPAGASLVLVLLEAVAPYLAASVLMAMLSVVLLVGVVVAAVRSASIPRNDRLARFVRLLERYSPEARRLGLSERLEPTTEERIEDLKQQYVEGEITELEYERRLQDLMSEEGVNDERARREQTGRERKGREREYEW
jgi:hypothetical protein